MPCVLVLFLYLDDYLWNFEREQGPHMCVVVRWSCDMDTGTFLPLLFLAESVEESLCTWTTVGRFREPGLCATNPSEARPTDASLPCFRGGGWNKEASGN